MLLTVIIKKTKSVKACTSQNNDVCFNKSEACKYIKDAMECLAYCTDDKVCAESIANLSVVLLDLTDESACNLL